MPDSITLLFTSDLHGRLEPKDPFTGRPFPGGLARAATLIRARAAACAHAMYLDLGDLVQGTPESTVAARARPETTHPMVRALRELGCRAMVLGNHEFHFGEQFLSNQRRSAEFPWLGANVIRADGRPAFEPVLRVDAGERRLAILGHVTPQVPRWEEPWNIAGLVFRDPVETAREWVPRLACESDAVIVAAHLGWEGVTDGSPEEAVPPENAGAALAAVPGIDALILAHTHRIEERSGPRGTCVVQAAWGGLAVGELTLRWADGSARPVASSRVHVVDETVPPDAKVMEIAEATRATTEGRLDRVIGEATGRFDLDGLRYRDNAVLSLYHRVHLAASGADLSSAVVFREEEEIAPGPIRERDLFRLYPFENDLTILELSVDDVRAYLEEIARVYTGPTRNGEPPPLDPRIRLYGQDALAPCRYVIDPGRPVGSRVTELDFGSGKWSGGRRLTIALSSYRAQGGGGFVSLRGARVVERTGRNLRDLLGEYIRKHGRISPDPFDNWRVVGTSTTEQTSVRRGLPRGRAGHAGTER